MPEMVGTQVACPRRGGVLPVTRGRRLPWMTSGVATSSADTEPRNASRQRLRRGEPLRHQVAAGPP